MYFKNSVLLPINETTDMEWVHMITYVYMFTSVKIFVN